jgi:hypothetical protein
VIAEHERSNQTVRAFCQQRQVGEHSFYMWRRRLAGDPTPVRFALVTTPAPSAAGQPAEGTCGIEVTLAGGERLRIAPGADAVTLRTVLSALRESR